jgi:hypothetical protein
MADSFKFSWSSVTFFAVFMARELLAPPLVPRDRGKPLKVFSREKFKVLAEKNGWSLARAEGFVDGESFRRRGKRPPKYVLVGIDEYCQGFRAGYFERKSGTMTANPPASAKL